MAHLTSDKHAEIWSFDSKSTILKPEPIIRQTSLLSWLENPSHSIEFDQPEILATANNLRELLIKETLLIHEHNPSINSDESSTPLPCLILKLNVILLLYMLSFDLQHFVFVFFHDAILNSMWPLM